MKTFKDLQDGDQVYVYKSRSLENQLEIATVKISGDHHRSIEVLCKSCSYRVTPNPIDDSYSFWDGTTIFVDPQDFLVDLKSYDRYLWERYRVNQGNQELMLETLEKIWRNMEEIEKIKEALHE